MYYRHNLQFRSAAAMMSGNLAEAREAGRKTAALVEPLAGEIVRRQAGLQRAARRLLPAREQLGAVLMRTGRAPEAEKVFRADLERNRLNPRSLFGLWKALERQGKTAQAAEARKAFEAAWQGADVELSESQFSPGS